MTNFNISDHEFYPVGKENAPAKQKKELSEKDLREIREKMKIEFALGWHNSAKDVEFIQQKFESCDVYIPEFAFYTPRIKEDLDEISNGEMTPSEFMEKYKEENINFPKFTFAILKMIYNSHKEIFLADIPGDTPELDQYLNIQKIREVNFDKFLKGELEEGLKSISQEINLYSDLEKKRGEYIAKKIENDLPAIIGKNKKLRKKPEINVLVSLGAVHTPAYIQLKKDNYDVNQSFPVKPFTFEPQIQGLRQKEFMPEKEISKDLLSRALMAEFLSTLFCFIEDQNLKDKLLSEINKRISIQEIENLSRKLKDNMARYEDKKEEEARKENLKIVFDLLETKGVPFEEGAELNDETVRELVEVLELENCQKPDKQKEITEKSLKETEPKNIETSLETAQANDFEKKETEPKISLHIFFAPHETSKDYEKLQKAFQEADVYIPEIYAWTPEGKSTFQNLSTGKLSLTNLLKKYPKLDKTSPRFKEYQMVYQSKKPILIIDISSRNKKILEEYREADSYYKKALCLFEDGNFKKSLEKMRACIIKESGAILKRDDEIRKNLKKEIELFLKDNPEYSNKDQIKILINMGASHTNLYHKIKKGELEVSREFNEMPFVFTGIDEAERKIIFKKELTDELLAKAIIEELLIDSSEILNLSNDTDKLFKLVRILSSKLSFKTIEKICKSMDDYPYFIEQLKKHGLKIPKSEQEIDEILGIKKINE